MPTQSSPERAQGAALSRIHLDADELRAMYDAGPHAEVTAMGRAAPRWQAVHESLNVRRLSLVDPDLELGGTAGAMVVVSLVPVPVIRRDSRGKVNDVARVGAVSVPPPDGATRYMTPGRTEVLSVELPGEVPPFSPMFLAEDRRLLKLAMQAFSDLSRDPDCPLLASSLRVAFETVLSAQTPSPRNGGLSPWQLRVVRDVIEAAATEPLARSPTLGDLAEAARSSPFHFAREFRRSTGTPPYAYTLERRVARARAALAGTDDTIGAIGFDCGFASASHFTRHFRSIVGISPSEFRVLVR